MIYAECAGMYGTLAEIYISESGSRESSSINGHISNQMQHVVVIKLRRTIKIVYKDFIYTYRLGRLEQKYFKNRCWNIEMPETPGET